MSWWTMPEPSLDPPEPDIVGYCEHCGGEIYDGETVYNIDRDLIHEDCLYDFAKDYFADCKEEVKSHAKTHNRYSA